MTTATEHLLSYVDLSDKPVVGTTYREMHELVDRLLNAGFFDASAGKETVATAAELPAHEETAEDELSKATHDEVAENELQQDGQFCNIHVLTQITFVDFTLSEVMRF